ncbi:MAG TPA: 50S ribosomal protein L16 [Candidatus Nanoarchaeia archaeon]|nr:50S ribosomal protein L16 [Candidatus Nanoarchaeia archaeon]
MAGLRPGHTIRKIKRAYTRKSKFKSKGYVKAVPHSKIVRFIFGDITRTFTHQLDYISKDDIQVRHNALESARQILTRHLEANLGKNFILLIRGYPHHVVREHKALTGAGADRMSQGMAHAFGKPEGVAVQAHRGKILFSIHVDKNDIDKARAVLQKANSRLPGHWQIAVSEGPKPVTGRQ